MNRNENCAVKRLEKRLQRVHKSSDGAVQIFVRPPHLFDFVDRVQHRSVVLAAELAADFRQRRGSELLDDVHGYLPGEGDCSRVAADLEILLAEIEVLAYALLDQIDRDALFLRRDN